MTRCTTHHHACACREAKCAELEREKAEIKLRCESLRQSYQKEIDALKRENAALRMSDKTDIRMGNRPTYRTLERENAALRKSIERHGQANDKLVMENATLRRFLQQLSAEGTVTMTLSLPAVPRQSRERCARHE